MQSSLLVDLLFRSCAQTSKTKKSPHFQSEEFVIMGKQSESRKKPSKSVKINQFSSSLIIHDEQVPKREIVLSTSASPHRNFHIKKVCDYKNKVVADVQKIVDEELKKREKLFNFYFNRSFSIENSIQAFQMALPTRSIGKVNESDGADCRIFETKVDQSISQCLFNQKTQLKLSKDILSETNSRWKANYHQKQGERALEVADFALKEEAETVPRTYTGSQRKTYSKHIQEQKKYQQMIERQRKEMLQLKKELTKNYAKPFSPPENITAYSYIIYEADAKKSKFLRKLSLRHEESQEKQETRKTLLNSHKVIVSEKSRAVLQVASLTKIMTCVLALDLSRKYCIGLRQEYTLIGMFEQNIGGTSANLQKGEIYSIWQLLHGLMLPSGNDASLAIAVWGGKVLLQNQSSKQIADSSSKLKKKDCYERFIAEMNSKAIDLNMEKTKYANSHGLSNYENRSCSYDLALLCEHAMSNKLFQEIVSCKLFQAVICFEKSSLLVPNQDIASPNPENPNENQAETTDLSQMKDFSSSKQNSIDEQISTERCEIGTATKTISWQNTHQLLHRKSNLYIGIKTGITNTAGPCLSSCVQINGRRFIIIVLNSKSMSHRFRDTELLRKWLFKKQQIKYKEQIKSSEQIEKQEPAELLQ